MIAQQTKQSFCLGAIMLYKAKEETYNHMPSNTNF